VNKTEPNREDAVVSPRGRRWPRNVLVLVPAFGNASRS